MVCVKCGSLPFIGLSILLPRYLNQDPQNIYSSKSYSVIFSMWPRMGPRAAILFICYC